MQRKISIKRKTNEVDITGSLNIDGSGKSKVKTGIDFLDHMLTLFSFFGFFDLEIEAVGDLSHHANEDVAIAIGKAFGQALGEGVGIKRYGFAFCPMDKSLSRCVIDISGRPSVSVVGKQVKTNAIDTTLEFTAIDPTLNYSLEEAKHFLEAFANSAKITINIEAQFDGDLHHFLEAIFKSFGLALDMATQIDHRREGVTSTKGVLDL
ncbi:MAG: imidazoleglycerol-phosphate dehydratase [Candidatus Omnitrophota bacterium]